MTVQLRGSSRRGLPEWFRQRVPGEAAGALSGYLKQKQINTVCGSAHCPNISECYSRGNAAFMILGDKCSRSCSFCAVEKAQGPFSVDADEPRRVAEAVKELGLRYVVITSPARDDLPDGGAGHFAGTIKEIKRINPGVKAEALIPDFKGEDLSLKTVLDASPACLAHNIETVPRLYGALRPGADYSVSLKILSETKRAAPDMMTKSSLMLGLSERGEEVTRVFEDLRRVECDILTLGQYLAPSDNNFPIHRFVTPDEFKEYEEAGLRLGFRAVFSGPKVRSSYLAEQMHSRAEALRK